MMKAGIIDPKKVTRVALENAASVAGMILTTECALVDIKEDTPAMPPMGGGGMPGMMQYIHPLKYKKAFAYAKAFLMYIK